MPAVSFGLQAIPLAMVFLVFHVVVIRPGRVAERARWQAVKALTGGERLVLASGMLATFVRLHGTPDHGEYEVALSDDVLVRVHEDAIARILPPVIPPVERAT